MAAFALVACGGQQSGTAGPGSELVTYHADAERAVNAIPPEVGELVIHQGCVALKIDENFTYTIAWPDTRTTFSSVDGLVTFLGRDFAIGTEVSLPGWIARYPVRELDDHLITAEMRSTGKALPDFRRAPHADCSSGVFVVT